MSRAVGSVRSAIGVTVAVTAAFTGAAVVTSIVERRASIGFSFPWPSSRRDPTVTLAADTRTAVRRRPFLREALRAGVVNYAAAARTLDVDGEQSAVVAALRRYAEELPAYDETPRAARVTMRSGLGVRAGGDEGGSDDSGDEGEDENRDADASGDGAAMLRVGEHALVPGAGTLTGVLVTGAVDGVATAHALGRLVVEGIDPVAAGFAGEVLAVVVARSDGPTAVRVVERALEAVPE